MAGGGPGGWSSTTTIQPLDEETIEANSSALVSKRPESFSETLVLPLARNFDAFYLNPDLEALLNTRGFSTKRPEIIGMFNYNAPLSRGGTTERQNRWSEANKNDMRYGYVNAYAGASSSPTYQINPSGELYDFQCQLKQLRYKDANGFFEQKIGITQNDSGALTILPGASNQMQNTAKELIQRYQKDMDTALDTLDYLTVIYNAITDFILAQDLNHDFDIFDRDLPNSTYPTPATTAVLSNTPTVKERSIGYPISISSDPMNFDYFLRFVTGQAVDGTSLIGVDQFSRSGSPDTYGANVRDSVVSGTWSMLTMMNIVMAGLYGMSSYPAKNVDFYDSFDKDEDYGKKLPGYLNFSSAIPPLLQSAYTSDNSLGFS